MPSYSRKIPLPGKTGQELYDKIEGGIEGFLNKTPLGKFDLARDAASRTIQIRSSLLTATLACQDGEISLDAKLSLIAAPMRGKIDEGIDRWIHKVFSPPA